MNDSLISTLIENCKYKIYPPKEEATKILDEYANRNTSYSGGAIKDVVNAFFNSIEKVLFKFADTLLLNPKEFEISSDEEVCDIINKKTEELFIEASNLLIKKFPWNNPKDLRNEFFRLKESLSNQLENKIKLHKVMEDKTGQNKVGEPNLNYERPAFQFSKKRKEQHQNKEFPFIVNGEFRNVVERDYSEIQRAFEAICWKSVIILSGGIIEAVLTDLLLQNQKSATDAIKAPKTQDITKWTLSDLIDVSVELKLISKSVEKLSHPIREYRNLVHPGNEIRNKLKFDEEEAKIAREVIHIIYRDLTS